MKVPQDGCLQRSSRPKKASATLYLMEELGDARLRCDQLMRYVDEAIKLIEKSSHKDHFFEVAGHLIKAVPETAFKLQKALQAVALAADRLDYEEIKQDLRPEKVEELERVLKEVRIRQVHRRSDPGLGVNVMTPKQAAEKIRSFAKTAREEGSLPLYEVAAFIHGLNPKRTASQDSEQAALSLDKIADALEADPAKVSRSDLATVLSRIAMESEFETAVRLASKPKLTQDVMQLGNVEEVKKKFKAENPSISDADLDEIAKQWEANKDVVKDKTALTRDPELVQSFDGIKTLALNASRAANVGRWRSALVSVYHVVDEIGTILVRLGSMDTLKSEALKREIRQTISTVNKSVKELSEAPVVTASAKWVEKYDSKSTKYWAADGKGDVIEEAQVHKINGPGIPLYVLKLIIKKGTPLRAKKEFMKLNDAMKSAEAWLESDEEGASLIMTDFRKWASVSDDAKRSRFEEGVKADPTENMSEEQKAKWKVEHKKHKDEFKSATGEAWKI